MGPSPTMHVDECREGGVACLAFGYLKVQEETEQLLQTLSERPWSVLNEGSGTAFNTV